MNIKDEKELISKPGDTILETIEHIKMSQAELAKRLGKTPSKVHDLITGKEPVTVNTALQLEKVLGIDAKFWLNMETDYREKLSRIEQEEVLQECIDWLKQQPIKELKKCGYIKTEKPDTSMVSECLQFYGVGTPVEWHQIYINDYAKTSFRKSMAFATALGSMAAWLRIGELGMRKLKLPGYNKGKFKEVLKQVKQIIRDNPEDFPGQLRELCRQAGVAVVFTPGLPKAPISGASRWVGGNPLIQLTDRYKSNDQFWFTFFHEVAHILLHGKKDVFIENFEGYEADEEKEEEANKFAADFLLSDSFLKEFTGEITEKEIKRVARAYNTHPAIVLARLQKMEIVSYSFGIDLKMKVILDYYTYKTSED